MGPEKVKEEFEIYLDSKEFLERIQDTYNHPDTSKTLRCLINFAQIDGNLDEIFKKTRCNRC